MPSPALNVLIVHGASGSCDAFLERLRADGQSVYTAVERVSAGIIARRAQQDAVLIGLSPDRAHDELARELRGQLPTTSVIIAIAPSAEAIDYDCEVLDMALREASDVERVSGLLHHQRSLRTR